MLIVTVAFPVGRGARAWNGTRTLRFVSLSASREIKTRNGVVGGMAGASIPRRNTKAVKW